MELYYQNENPWEKQTKVVEEMNPLLFDRDEFSATAEEWQDMPEFVMKQQVPYAELVFRFASKEDLQTFSKVIGINLTENSKGTWYPPFTGTISSSALKSERRYVDEP